MNASQLAWIAYEQPLSERVRTMLRLEHLFQRARHALNFDDVWASRSAIECLIGILAVLGRADLKKELIKELERHALTLESLSRNPNVDLERLQSVSQQVRSQLTRLKNSEPGFGLALRTNELFNSVRQRSSIPAGTCDFDLPALHYWLERSDSERKSELSGWLSNFDDLIDAVTLCLKLVRESGVSSNERAVGGLFQRALETTTPCQMVRVMLPRTSDSFPEISAGRHRFAVRFMIQHETSERPQQLQQDVDFRLVCCVI